MPTNTLTPGTANVTINVSQDERNILGKLAASKRCSVGYLVRSAMLAGLEQLHPSEAAEIKRIRDEWHTLQTEARFSRAQSKVSSSPASDAAKLALKAADQKVSNPKA